MTITKLLRGIAWRVLHSTEFLVYTAGPVPEAPIPPDDFVLVQVSAQEPTDQALAVEAMLAAGEDDTVALRLAQGHAFFGWKHGDRVVSFGWVCDSDRVIGIRRARENPRRAFLYNFHTLPDYRGKGLYPELLSQIRYSLGQAGKTEFIISVYASNSSSDRGIKKAGFEFTARTLVRTGLLRIQWEARGSTMDSSLSTGGVW